MNGRGRKSEVRGQRQESSKGEGKGLKVKGEWKKD
jgi:hypothetical protein